MIGALDAERLTILRATDAIVQEDVRAADLYDALWQAFAVRGSTGLLARLLRF